MAFLFLGMLMPDITSRPVINIASIYVFNTAQILSRETSDERALHFSKFASVADKSQVPSRTAWLITIVPILVVDLAIMALNFGINGRLIVLTALAAMHYLRRIWEILHVHIYSTHMTHGAIGHLLINNLAVLISLIFCMRYVHPTIYDLPASRIVLAVGIITFLVGEAAVVYHHQLLADLRRGKTGEDAKKYAIPRGGLFELVACPHYLGHLISWLGIGITSQSWLGIICQLLITLAFFIPRSKRTADWYTNKFEDYPESRRQLVPYFK
ncbi:3-oxo-5-alpha-steroid 4-dehydrogenase-domain-containing protein [Endogone sp. FLAS-F59071]|nr:3-oxo-5-alpha-steroid 4-dehydrogenase-domain-containing protein [Endogone sp. FLAS-F59071]|eukprot:RUS20500.1 3-oxo-5-alpha-steroid 4-dehydrogenase-domain-containing protein [Endogone sp. FLAS-F59071]